MMARDTPFILYVDDDAASRQVFTWILREAGFQTREAGTGREALRLAEEKPDLVILDVNLPDIDGFEVCRRIKSHPATAAIPVLHMSGVFVRSEDKTQALEGGADGYLTKPVEPREVVATVKSLLRIHHARRRSTNEAREWQATFDAIHDAVWVLDAQGWVLHCNQAMAALLGRPAEALLGRPYRELLTRAFGAGAEPLAAALLPVPGARPLSTQLPELPLGSRWFRVSSDPVPGEGGEPAGWVHLLTDVTRRKALEEQLISAQKMEAVGRLAGGVAHDFNNLLTIITGNLTLLLRTTGSDDPDREMLRNTEKAAWRAADLTRQLLDFARQTRLLLVPTNLNGCVAETLALLGRTLDHGIAVVVRGASDLWPVLADPGQMTQVLMNLCLNARDAMPRGGRLTITLENLALPEDPGPAHLQARRGEFVRLRVQDTGHGVPVEIQPRIFDPFFTTKDYGQGTGLGLAVVFGIVQQHHGWVECSSIQGEGACFDVYLPRHA